MKLPSNNETFSAIFSAFANACMIIGAIMTIGYSLIDLPASIDDRKLIRLDKLPLYFGTVLFAFEGIALGKAT